VTNVGPITTPNAAGTQPVPSPVTAAMPSKGLALCPVKSPVNAARLIPTFNATSRRRYWF
ncbi:hypothetical protein C0992_012016, partial [Termitomyces sp. T32_za158]